MLRPNLKRPQVHVLFKVVPNNNKNVIRENGRDLTKSYDKSPYTHRKSKKHRDNIKNATKNFDYTTIAHRLRTVSFSKSSHPNGVVKPVYER